MIVSQRNMCVTSWLYSVAGYSVLVIALQMEPGDDTTLSHAVRHFGSMRDPSVTFTSTRKTHKKVLDLSTACGN